MRILDEGFYGRSPDSVARNLLGRLLVCESSEGTTSGYVVETEAYFGEEDPASRAAQNGRTKMTEGMWGEPGTVFVYMVHGHWMLNVVTGEKEKPSAVLFRALEPKEGIELMKERRNKDRLIDLCSGPGKLTQALGVDKSLSGASFSGGDSIYVTDDGLKAIEIEESNRIGVTEDMDRPLRFFLKDNDFVSR